MSFTERLDGVILRHDEIAALMASGDLDTARYADLSKEYADLSPVVEKARELKAAREELAGLEEMIGDAATDAEMRALAEEESYELQERIPELEENLRILLLPKDAADEKSAILEIRAGTGGEEAALFAGDLMRMYQRYAELHGWRTEYLSLSETELGGVKEVALSIAGRGVFARLKFESGVHRVQRVPVTESGGRIHTSAATVAVLPEVEEVDIEVDDNDLRVDTYRASGAGGQHVNKTDSAVRLTHLPTGIVVQCQNDRSQHKNRATAMKMMQARLYEAELQAREAAAQAEHDAKTDIGWGHQIRSYVLHPYQMVKDLRTGVETGNAQGVLDGDLDRFLEASLADRLGGGEGGDGGAGAEAQA